jgi:ribosomal protein L2
MHTDLKVARRKTVVGVFQSHEKAEQAVAQLKHDGFRDDQISLVGKNKDGTVKKEGSHAAAGAATGAAVGAGTAALVSLGMTFGVIPLIGPVLALGPLAAALLSAAGGVAAGGLAGALVGMEIPEHEAKYYEVEVKSGRFLVAVTAADRNDEAWARLHGLGAYNHDTAAKVSTMS